ncbi:hypothetical protein NKH85_11695 [Mesorhizobium sp. M0924]|uniref:hypothetical protein n=1 Tax=unclassified Mesorhizobium TaxID=325217 RepID=UPI003339EC67
MLIEPAVLVMANDKEPPEGILRALSEAGYVADGSPQQLVVPMLFDSEPPTRTLTVTRLKKAAAGAAPQ